MLYCPQPKNRKRVSLNNPVTLASSDYLNLNSVCLIYVMILYHVSGIIKLT